MRDRGWRRAQRARKIEAIRKWLWNRNGRLVAYKGMDAAREEVIMWAKHRYSAPACCSGFCCGNPRRHFGELTMAERRVRQNSDLDE